LEDVESYSPSNVCLGNDLRREHMFVMVCVMGWSNGPKTWSELNARLSDGRRRVTSPRPGVGSGSGSEHAPPGRDGEPDAESAADGFDGPVLERHGRVVPIGKPGRVDNIPPIAEATQHKFERAGGSQSGLPVGEEPPGGTRSGAELGPASVNRGTSESGWRPGRARTGNPKPNVEPYPSPQAKKEWDGGPRPDGGDAQAWARKRAPYEPTPSQARTQTAETVPYAELHCHSNFSFLDGASHPEELVEEAVRLGLKALAITDHDGLYGVVRFAEAARAHGLPTVFGSELTLHAMERADQRVGNPDPDGDHLVVLAADPIGYGRLARAIATSHLAAQRPVARTARC
jgi:PHP domain